MNACNAMPDDLAELLVALVEHGSPVSETALQENEALEAYVDYFSMHALLEWRFATPSIAPRVASPVLQSLGTPARRISFTPRILGWGVSLLLVSYLAALVGLLAWDRAHQAEWRTRNSSRGGADTVATLTKTHDCQWKETPAVTGERLATQPLKLQHGLAELKFDDGTRVIVEGPAEFEVRTRNGGFLRHGRLVAHVPRQAIGFTIATPTAEIVDLGTEFGVEVSADGVADVAVLKGRVDVKPTSKVTLKTPANQRQLGAGEAVRIDGQGNVQDRDSAVATFTQLSARLTPLRPLDLSTLPEGIRLWLRADQGVELDTEGRIERWRDQSGHGFDAVQQHPDERPLLVIETAQGPGRAAAFDGVNDSLTCDSGIDLDNAGNMTLFLLLADVPKFTANTGVFCLRPRTGIDKSASDGFAIDLDDVHSPTSINAMQGMDRVSPPAGWDPMALPGYFKARWPAMVVVTKQNGTAALRINGQTLSVDSYHYVGSAAELINTAGYVIGNRIGFPGFSNICVAELLICDRAYTGREATTIEKQILERYSRPIDESSVQADREFK
jgi:hypothetical protein